MGFWVLWEVEGGFLWFVFLGVCCRRFGGVYFDFWWFGFGEFLLYLLGWGFFRFCGVCRVGVEGEEVWLGKVLIVFVCVWFCVLGFGFYSYLVWVGVCCGFCLYMGEMDCCGEWVV